MSRAFHRPDHVSRVESDAGDPIRPVRFDILITRPDPTRPDLIRPASFSTPPDPTRGRGDDQCTAPKTWTIMYLVKGLKQRTRYSGIFTRISVLHVSHRSLNCSWDTSITPATRGASCGTCCNHSKQVINKKSTFFPCGAPVGLYGVMGFIAVPIDKNHCHTESCHVALNPSCFTSRSPSRFFVFVSGSDLSRDTWRVMTVGA